MDRDLAELIFEHIKKFKYNFPGVKVKVELLNDEIFVLHNNLYLSDDTKYQLLVYNFSREYLNYGYSVFWGSDININDDDLSLIIDTCSNSFSSEDFLNNFAQKYNFGKFQIKQNNNNISENTYSNCMVLTNNPEFLIKINDDSSKHSVFILDESYKFVA